MLEHDRGDSLPFRHRIISKVMQTVFQFILKVLKMVQVWALYKPFLEHGPLSTVATQLEALDSL